MGTAVAVVVLTTMLVAAQKMVVMAAPVDRKTVVGDGPEDVSVGRKTVVRCWCRRR
jgi:hypothetical protein